MFLELLQQIIGDFSVGAYDHRFLHSIRVVGAGRNVVVMNINGKALQPGRLSQNDLHGAHGRFAGLNILCRCAIVKASLVVRFDLLDLFLIKQDLGDPRMIFDGHSDTVSHSLIHRITVDLRAEGLIGLVDGCARKADEGCVWECLFQNLCIRLGYHRLHIFIRILAEPDPVCVFELCSVCLVRETNDIGTVVDQSDFVIFTVTEFLDRADIKAAAFPHTKLLPQGITASDNLYLTKIQKILALGK